MWSWATQISHLYTHDVAVHYRMTKINLVIGQKQERWFNKKSHKCVWCTHSMLSVYSLTVKGYLNCCSSLPGARKGGCQLEPSKGPIQRGQTLMGQSQDSTCLSIKHRLAHCLEKHTLIFHVNISHVVAISLSCTVDKLVSQLQLLWVVKLNRKAPACLFVL